TPHAGLVQMFGARSVSWLVSAWSRKPQSMHAMAPGSRGLPHAGHAVGVPPAAFAAASAEVIDGRFSVGTDEEDGDEGGREDEDPGAPAPTVWSAGAAAGTVNGFLQLGQRNALPAESSGSCIAVLQCGQWNTCGMFYSRCAIVAVSLSYRSYGSHKTYRTDSQAGRFCRSPKTRTLRPTRITSPEGSGVGPSMRRSLANVAPG